MTTRSHQPTSFKVGQVWSYQTRPGESQSRLTVVHIDHDPRLGTIVHVRLTGLHLRNPRTPGGIDPEFSHLPFAARAVEKSVTAKLSDHGPLGNYLEGYHIWRQDFDAGKAGIFTAPVAEVVDGLEQGLNQH